MRRVICAPTSGTALNIAAICVTKWSSVSAMMPSTSKQSA